MDIDECASGPCQNGGTCNDTLNAFTCSCNADFFGDECQHFDNCFEQPCLNSGLCTDLDGGHECNCTLTGGFYGVNCTLEDECQTQSIVCSNGGSCVDEPEDDWQCDCVDG